MLHMISKKILVSRMPILLPIYKSLLFIKAGHSLSYFVRVFIFLDNYSKAKQHLFTNRLILTFH